MGLTDSPYRSLQLMIKAKFIAYANREKRCNPFHWEKVILNLPGAKGYNPRLPWVMKVRWDGNLACEVYVYVDDGRITGWSKIGCWRASRQFCAILTWLGIQDASRKRTGPSLDPGPWAGTVVHTKDNVIATVTKLKWQKTQALLKEISDMLLDDMIHHKRLEQIRGFLIYVARTYKWVNPYLKGIHQTLDSWRPGRKKDGWSAPRKQGRVQVWQWEQEEWIDLPPGAIKEADTDEAPEFVKSVPRLSSDIQALQELFSGSTPAVQACRAEKAAVALYLVGDASGQDLGSALWDDRGIQYEAGNWAAHKQDRSSNWREAANLASRIQRLAEQGGSWWRSGSGDPWGKRKLKMLSPQDWFLRHECEEPRLWCPPPAAMETVVELFNEDRLAHPKIPHVFAIPRLMTHLWRKHIRKDADLAFEVAPGAPFWPKTMHEPLILFVILPIGFTPSYRGPWSMCGSRRSFELGKELDSRFKRPREHGRQEFHDLDGSMPDLWEGEEAWSGDLLRKFLEEQERFPPVLSCMCYKEYPQDPFPVQTYLEEEDENEDLVTEEDLNKRFRKGRNGDFVMGFPFECDLCHFRNVSRRDPNPMDRKDQFTLMCIRRANLDAMWSRETSTVSSNLSRLQQDYRESMHVFSMEDPLPVLGHDDVKDRAGMKCALFTLNASLRTGRYADHLQWDSMRKTPTWYNNAYEAGEEASESAVFAAYDKKMYVSEAPTSSKWFPRFMLGAK
ncbi:hypothetical protein ACHAXR_005038 [Thalassiosira sp. AJA248-18]